MGAAEAIVVGKVCRCASWLRSEAYSSLPIAAWSCVDLLFVELSEFLRWELDHGASWVVPHFRPVSSRCLSCASCLNSKQSEARSASPSRWVRISQQCYIRP